MHPTVLLFVLLFLPNTDLSDWQQSPTLQHLMSTGAVGLMNARTADLDQITEDAGERTILAGARLGGSDDPQSENYATLANNLPDALIAANVALVGFGQMQQLNMPGYNPSPSAQLTVVHLTGSSDQIEQQLQEYTTFVSGKRAWLMVVSPNPSQSEYDSLHQLTPVVLWGPGIAPGYLVSPSTRTSGLITNTDIAPTIASALGAQLPVQSFGSFIGDNKATDDHVATLLQREATWISQAQALRLLPYIAGALALIVAIAVLISVKSRLLATKLAAFAVIVPLAILLSSNYLILAGFLGLAIVATAFVLKPADTVFFTAATVGIMVCVDAFLFSGRLTGQSILGYSPIEGARYYGVGNEVMGAYIGALAVLTGFWDLKGKNRTQLIALWLLAGLSLALPSAGAKAGGLIVCLTTLAAYFSVGSGRKLTDPITVVAIAGALLASIALLVVLSRFGPHTHVSEALSMAKADGGRSILDTILRKVEMDVHLVFHSVWIWVLAATTYGRWRLRRTDILAAVGTIATLACLLFNDSGVVAAAICSIIVWAAEFNRADVRTAKAKRSTATVGRA